MRSNTVFTAARISGWAVTSIVVISVLALAGKLGAVLSNGVYALTVLVGIAAIGGLLARMGGSAAPAAPTAANGTHGEMRGLIAPFYATLHRRVPAQEDEQAGGDRHEYEFDASTASIVDDAADEYADATGRPVYALKRYARSPEGEYFWMVLEVGPEGAPRLAFIKHVPRHVARYALKDKYIAPPR